MVPTGENEDWKTAAEMSRHLQRHTGEFFCLIKWFLSLCVLKRNMDIRRERESVSM